jgi:hypothetical protein
METICKVFALFGLGYLAFRMFRSRYGNFAKIAGFLVALFLLGAILSHQGLDIVTMVCGTVGLAIAVIACLDRWHAEWWQIAVPLVLAFTIGLFMWAPVIFGTTSIMPTLPSFPTAPAAPSATPTPTAPTPIPGTSTRSHSRTAPVVDECESYKDYSPMARARLGCP